MYALHKLIHAIHSSIVEDFNHYLYMNNYKSIHMLFAYNPFLLSTIALVHSSRNKCKLIDINNYNVCASIFLHVKYLYFDFKEKLKKF